MGLDFKNPNDADSDEAALEEFGDEEVGFGIAVALAAPFSDDSFDATAIDSDVLEDSSDMEDATSAPWLSTAAAAAAPGPSTMNTRSTSRSTSRSTEEMATQTAGNDAADGPSCSSGVRNEGRSDGGDAAEAQDIDCEDDETVRAIIAAIKKPRTAPPDIKLEDFITDICFHHGRNIIALGTITGDICLYEYADEGNTLLRTIEVHAKACRDVEFTEDGQDLLSCSKDKSIMVTDMKTEKLKRFYESAHDDAINKLHVIDEHLFATGDDNGTVKLWDLRTKDEIFSLKEVEDYITQMLTNDAKKLLLVTSGDGHLTTLNLTARKLFVQSEPYEEELTCMGLYRGDSKLVVGTSKGRLYTYNWGQFGYHCDMFPGIKGPIGEMIPITDRVACVAGEEGIIHACHIAPFRVLGVVGQHNMPVECLDISSCGELIASSSHNNDVSFWNVTYFENMGDIKYNEKHNTYREKRHNLPSSKFDNASDFFSDLASKQPDDGAE